MDCIDSIPEVDLDSKWGVIEEVEVDGDEGNLIAGDDSENLENCAYFSFMNTSELEIWTAYSRQHICVYTEIFTKICSQEG